jgi:hypothetical protein
MSHNSGQKPGMILAMKSGVGRNGHKTSLRTNSMFKSFKSIAGAAIILATIATVSAQARQIETETPRAETVQKQKAQSYVWLVLGVGF